MTSCLYCLSGCFRRHLVRRRCLSLLCGKLHGLHEGWTPWHNNLSDFCILAAQFVHINRSTTWRRVVFMLISSTPLTAPLQWRHYTPPCWRYTSCEQNRAKLRKSEILRPMLFGECVFRLAIFQHALSRGSVVRTSVFDWRTFPDLRLIYGWHVTTSWVRCPLWVNQPGQLSLPCLQGR